MKKLSLYVFLVLMWCNVGFADDIADYEIEGMSLGNSLLNYFSEKKIKEGIREDYYTDYKTDEFLKVEFWNLNLKVYDVTSAHIKKNDKKYIAYEISGAILFEENVSDCYPKKNEIDKEISLQFPNAERFDSGRQIHPRDKTKKSSYDRVDFDFLSGNSIDIICYDWSEATGFSDHLSVGIESKEFSKWLSDD